MKRTNKFFNKNFSSEVNILFNLFINQEIRDLNSKFNYRRLRNEIEKLKAIPVAEQPEVIKKAIAGGSHTFEHLTDREKASIGNKQWDWGKEYLNHGHTEKEESEAYFKTYEEWNRTLENGVM